MIPHKSQVSFLVARGSSGLHLIYCRGFGLISQLGGTSWYFSSFSGDLGVPLELRQGPQGTFRVASGKSSLLSSFEKEVNIALEVLQGNRASSGVEGGNLAFFFFLSCGGSMGFFSNCKEDLRAPIMLPQGSQASFRVARAPQDSSRVTAGELALLSG